MYRLKHSQVLFRKTLSFLTKRKWPGREINKVCTITLCHSLWDAKSIRSRSLGTHRTWNGSNRRRQPRLELRLAGWQALTHGTLLRLRLSPAGNLLRPINRNEGSIQEGKEVSQICSDARCQPFDGPPPEGLKIEWKNSMRSNFLDAFPCLDSIIKVVEEPRI
jgi:hypothetical protein